MTITEINGDVLNVDTEMVCHQVNFFGIMGAGLAKQIKTIYPKVFREYYAYCRGCNFSNEVLNNVLFCRTDKYIIANCFSQNSIGYGVCQTNYDAFIKCMHCVRQYAEENGITTISFPYKIGCGLAGGSWETILNIIETAFNDSDLNIKIVKLQ